MHTIEPPALTINIPAKKNVNYPIFINQNILDKSGEIIKISMAASKVLLVSNETVYPLYGDIVEKSLLNSGLIVEKHILPDGEDYKNIDTFRTILDRAVDSKLERKDAIVALGGGVVGDMAGYAAASYLRGISLVQIATTLLAQVDSSVGGKVGINHQKGKNLIGAFYQPECVIIDPLTLETLDERNLKNGLAEVLKYAFIEKSCNMESSNLNFFDYLLKNKAQIYWLDYEILKETISYCCKIKACVVEQDEKESGLRAILNLGHTTGHALEVAGNYKILTHGEAVSIGIIAALNMSKALNLLDNELAEKGKQLIINYELSHKIPSEIKLDKVIEAMKLDKKVQAGKIRFVLPVKEIGRVEIFDNIEQQLVIDTLKGLY